MSNSTEKSKTYSNGEIDVIWKPGLCIHSAECVKRLPNVYKPNERPWIQIENATTDELKEQISACPSGALSYEIPGEAVEVETVAENTKVEVVENGPLLVYGTIDITDRSGAVSTKKRSTAFCRCGHSENKPYCDGAHNDRNFVG